MYVNEYESKQLGTDVKLRPLPYVRDNEGRAVDTDAGSMDV